MNDIFVCAMKRIFICVLILLVQKNCISCAESGDYDGLFTEDITAISSVAISPPTTPIPVLKKTTTLRPSEKKVPPSLVRVSTNNSWEEPEVTIFSIFVKKLKTLY